MSLTVETDAVPIRTDSSGTVRVGQSRVPIDSVVFSYLEGATADEIADQFPSLELADIYATIAYYLRHREQVDEYLRQREVEADKLRQEIERRFPPAGLRERLVARRQRQQEQQAQQPDATSVERQDRSPSP
ncbi:MAG: DUF433 domain-containing protein [Planctomycetales bacterium]|nr:DUF433 domain-containing protein [Planctomycetales bacterium]